MVYSVTWFHQTYFHSINFRSTYYSAHSTFTLALYLQLKQHETKISIFCIYHSFRVLRDDSVSRWLEFQYHPKLVETGEDIMIPYSKYSVPRYHPASAYSPIWSRYHPVLGPTAA